MKLGCGCIKYPALFIFIIFTLTGCAPTYPKEKFKESIIRLCKSEYNMDVKVRTVGKTLAIYMPIEDLMDQAFGLTPQATEVLNNIILSVTRVVLSTDADYDFYCVITHDDRIPEIQVIIIKYVNDVKRVFLGDISRGEFGKRMIVDMRLNPQSQKERSVKEVFERLNLDPQWQDKVMNDFFRSEPTMLGDIGYWNSRFYIKDIMLPEFLSEQIAGRVKMEFREDKKLLKNFIFKNAKSTYNNKDGKVYFYVEYSASLRKYDEALALDLQDYVLKAVIRVINQVIHGYLFTDFDYVEINDQSEGRVIRISKDMLEQYRLNKVKFEEIVR